MILLQAQNVARYFGSDRLFSNISMTVSDRDRIGLVGRNGSGKSTLLKILVGEESSDEGQVSLAKNISLGYLSQRTGIISDRTVWDEMLTVFDRAQAIGKEMELVEEDLANPAVLNDPDRYQDRLNKYDSLQAQFKEARGYSYKSEIKTVLAGFRFYEEDYDSRITELSGGQKTRLALAKLLLTRPDLLVLDEPTNHLDMDTLTWLEDYLQGYQGAILIVSHDRYFLDLLVKDIYDLSFGQLTHYPGNYSNYLMEKEKRVEKQWKDYEKQQKEIKKLEDFVQKNITRASTSKRAQSRQKQLDNMIRIDRPQTHQKSAKIIFQPDQESGDLVLQVHDLTIGYDGEATAKNINLEERKGDIIAIVGSNGVGKTTLLKSLVGDLPLLEGDVQIGTKVDIGYYDQEQQHLHQNKTILNELWDDHPNLDENVIRTLLGSFLFSGDDVLKSIYSLSGGEKARVALAKLALQKDNFLILDEPTNHLDIDSKEVLEDALDSFAGTILFVSHDRYFINRIANKVVELEENGTTLYLGNYDYYLQKKEELKEIQALNTGDQDSNNRIEASKEKESETALDREELKDFQRQQRRLSRDLEAVEEELNQLEEERQSHHNQLLQPEIYNDLQRSQELADRLDLVKQEIEDKSQQWEDLALALEELEQK